MRVSREKAAENRERIIAVASTLLREKGFDGIGVAHIMKAAEDSLYPERSRVFENLGLVSLQLKQREQAKQYFEKALRLNRRQPSALLEMSQLSYDDRQYVPARDYYNEYLKQGQQNAKSLLLGVRLARVFDDKDTAASYGLQLKRLYPASPEYQAYQAEK